MVRIINLSFTSKCLRFSPVKFKWLYFSDGLCKKFLARVGLGYFFCSGQVGSVTSGSGNFPPKSQIFQFFSLRVKKSHQVRSKMGRPPITVGQKYARVGSGPISKVYLGQFFL